MKVEETQEINGKFHSVRVYYVRKGVPIFRAIMIPYIGIFIRDMYRGDEKLLRHEMIHYLQFKRMGFVMFLIRYLLQLLFIGYDTMPMELEARQELETPYNYRKRFWKHR